MGEVIYPLYFPEANVLPYYGSICVPDLEENPNVLSGLTNIMGLTWRIQEMVFTSTPLYPGTGFVVTFSSTAKKEEELVCGSAFQYTSEIGITLDPPIFSPQPQAKGKKARAAAYIEWFGGLPHNEFNIGGELLIGAQEGDGYVAIDTKESGLELQISVAGISGYNETGFNPVTYDVSIAKAEVTKFWEYGGRYDKTTGKERMLT